MRRGGGGGAAALGVAVLAALGAGAGAGAREAPVEASRALPELPAGSPTHEDYMRAAVFMAELNPAAPYGAVIVNTTTGDVVCRGVNNAAHDPTHHGEMQAIHDCASSWPQLRGPDAKAEWAKLELYTTAEPCPMCMAGIEWCGMRAVYFGTSLWTLEGMGLHQIDIPAEDVSAKKNFGTKANIYGGVLREVTDPLFQAIAPGSKGKGVVHDHGHLHDHDHSDISSFLSAKLGRV